MSSVMFTKRVRNDQFAFEGYSENGHTVFNVKPNRMGRPFVMARKDAKSWVISPGQNVEPEIIELERTLAEIIKQNNKG